MALVHTLLFFRLPIGSWWLICINLPFLHETISARPNSPPVTILSQESPLESPDHLLDRVQSLI